ncbi:hypothetical protein [Streptosporangium jomthongense]|uniref:Tyr recombinase domain-containing protein n=1 Tax=Streptosporangium jomthongense TaxID=1193683 RepID=A0ABV8F4G1_9ACTN
MLAKSTVLRIWRQARKKALSPEEYASPLARRPYDLRHACLPTWLNAGVAPKQVAEWAGNNTEVLHRTYEKCLTDHGKIAMRRISEVLRSSPRESIGKNQPTQPVRGGRSRTPLPDSGHEKAQLTGW